MGRGALTKEVKELSKVLLGYEINVRELRLMPYISYIMMNNQKLEPAKISSEEREILSNWRAKNFITGGASEKMTIDYNFWINIHKILYISYI